MVARLVEGNVIHVGSIYKSPSTGYPTCRVEGRNAMHGVNCEYLVRPDDSVSIQWVPTQLHALPSHPVPAGRAYDVIIYVAVIDTSYGPRPTEYTTDMNQVCRYGGSCTENFRVLAFTGNILFICCESLNGFLTNDNFAVQKYLVTAI